MFLWHATINLLLASMLGRLQPSNQRPPDRGVPVEPPEREPGGHEALVLQGRLEHEAARE